MRSGEVSLEVEGEDLAELIGVEVFDECGDEGCDGGGVGMSECMMKRSRRNSSP